MHVAYHKLKIRSAQSESSSVASLCLSCGHMHCWLTVGNRLCSSSDKRPKKHWCKCYKHFHASCVLHGLCVSSRRVPLQLMYICQTSLSVALTMVVCGANTFSLLFTLWYPLFTHKWTKIGWRNVSFIHDVHVHVCPHGQVVLIHIRVSYRGDPPLESEYCHSK